MILVTDLATMIQESKLMCEITQQSSYEAEALEPTCNSEVTKYTKLMIFMNTLLPPGLI